MTFALLVLPSVVRLDGKPHADFEQFLGRFHPLAVHLPIGLLVIVPVLELAGARRRALREAASLVLVLAFAACLGSVVLGYLLAHGSGETGAIVARHMWGAIVLTILAMLCLIVRPGWADGAAGAVSARAYPALLVAAMIALIWTADQGGSLTHGSSYLTEYAPAPIKRVVSLGSTQPSATSFYSLHINPIFDANCIACHGASKTEGGLRLDSYEAVMRGGKDGATIIAGAPEKSLLLTRVTLPAGDQHAMPAEGRPPLRPQEIAWIRAWIEQGASPTAASLAGVEIAAPVKELPPEPVGDYSALMPEIRAMDQGPGAKLVPVSSKPSDGLVLNTTDVAANFGDADLARLEKFGPYIVEAELGRTAVTDSSFATLAKFSHLRALHLEGTVVTGSRLGQLAGLSHLTYLNLSGTRVTQAAVAPLASMKNLRHIYLFNTPADTRAGADAAQDEAPARSTP